MIDLPISDEVKTTSMKFWPHRQTAGRRTIYEIDVGSLLTVPVVAVNVDPTLIKPLIVGLVWPEDTGATGAKQS